ncbi:MAG: glycosyltransferase [Pseudomonadota bacterium]
MLKSARLTVSIVLFNSPLEPLSRTVNSLGTAVHAAREAGVLEKAQVYLIDNASAADYRSRLEVAYPDWALPNLMTINYRPQDDNGGFGAGHNRVLPELDGALHLVLNPDVELEPDALVAGMGTLAKRLDIVLLAPAARGEEGEWESLCKRYPSVWVLLLRGFVPGVLQRPFRRQLEHYQMRDLGSPGQAADVPIASGCFMLLRSDALQSMGGFDEGFFLYFEDFDLSLRLSAVGRLMFWPDMRIVHHGGNAAAKGGQHILYFVRSAWRFFQRHGWRWV